MYAKQMKHWIIVYNGAWFEMLNTKYVLDLYTIQTGETVSSMCEKIWNKLNI